MKRFLGLNVWLAVLIVAGVQSAALGYMVANRAQLLQNGREITLDVKPVDPRSLFRGDYVILNYGDLSRIESALLKDVPDGTRQVFVALRKGAAGPAEPVPSENGQGEVSPRQAEWSPVAVSADYPATVTDGDVVLRGDVGENYRDRISSANAVPVDYGIESYFVPEGEGKRLEKLIGKGEMRVIAAVASDGRVGIKGIEAQGKRVYEEKVW